MTRGTTMISMIVYLLISLSGCTTVMNGGAPPPSFDIENDLRILEAKFGDAVTIENVYKDGATKEKRNRMIAGRLVMINLRYLQFIKNLNAEKQFIDTASDITILSLNLAGTAFTPTNTKTILSAISAVISGSKLSIDKHYYYEKTMPALIASMNAQRKLVLVSILEGIGKSLELYSVEQAVTDLDSYYHAGTLIGAINAIQVIANEKEKESSEKIEEITRARIYTLLPDKTRLQLKGINDAIKGLTDFAKAQEVLNELGPDSIKPKDISEAIKQLKMIVRQNRFDEAKVQTMYDVFKKTGILK